MLFWFHNLHMVLMQTELNKSYTLPGTYVWLVVHSIANVSMLIYAHQVLVTVYWWAETGDSNLAILRTALS